MAFGTKQQASTYSNDGIPHSMMQMTQSVTPRTRERKSYLHKGERAPVEQRMSGVRKTAIQQSLAVVLGGSSEHAERKRSSSAPGRKPKRGETDRKVEGSKSGSGRLGAMQRSLFHTPTNTRTTVPMSEQQQCSSGDSDHYMLGPSQYSLMPEAPSLTATKKVGGGLISMPSSLFQSPAAKTPDSSTPVSMQSRSTLSADEIEELKDSPPPFETTPQPAAYIIEQMPEEIDIAGLGSPSAHARILKDPRERESNAHPGPRKGLLRRGPSSSRLEGMTLEDLKARVGYVTKSQSQQAAEIEHSSRINQRSADAPLGNNEYSSRRSQRTATSSINDDYSSRRTQRTLESLNDDSSRRSQRTWAPGDDFSSRRSQRSMDWPQKDISSRRSQRTATTTATSFSHSTSAAEPLIIIDMPLNDSQDLEGLDDSSRSSKPATPKQAKNINSMSQRASKFSSKSPRDRVRGVQRVKSSSLPSRNKTDAIPEEMDTTTPVHRALRRSSSIDITSDNWCDMELDLSQFADMDNSFCSRRSTDGISVDGTGEIKKPGRRKSTSFGRRRSIDFGGGDDVGDAGTEFDRKGPKRQSSTSSRRRRSVDCDSDDDIEEKKSKSKTSSMRRRRSIDYCVGDAVMTPPGKSTSLRSQTPPGKRSSSRSQTPPGKRSALRSRTPPGKRSALRSRTPPGKRGCQTPPGKSSSLRSQRSIDYTLFDETAYSTPPGRSKLTRSRQSSIDTSVDSHASERRQSRRFQRCIDLSNRSATSGHSERSQRSIDYGSGDDIEDSTPVKHSNSGRGHRSVDGIGKKTSRRKANSLRVQRSIDAALGDEIELKTPTKRSASMRGQRSIDFGDDIIKTGSNSVRSHRSVDYIDDDSKRTPPKRTNSSRRRRSIDCVIGDDADDSVRSRISALEKKGRKHQKSKKRDMDDAINDDTTPPWLVKALETERAKVQQAESAQAAEAIPEDSSLQGSLILPDEEEQLKKASSRRNSFDESLGDSSWRDLDFDLGLPTQYVVGKPRDEISIADSKSKSQDSSLDTGTEHESSIRSLKPANPSGKGNEHSVGSIMDGFPKLSIQDKHGSATNVTPNQSASENPSDTEKLPGYGPNGKLKDILPGTNAHVVQKDAAAHKKIVNGNAEKSGDIAPASSRKPSSVISTQSSENNGSLCGMEIQVAGSGVRDMRKKLLKKLLPGRSKPSDYKKSKKWEMCNY